jgi:hypothetical protein
MISYTVSSTERSSSPYYCAERIDNNNTGVEILDLPDDLLQNPAQVPLQNELAEVDEADCAVEFGLVEERELLLVAQHLDSWLAQNSEVQRRPIGSGVDENELMRKRCLAASRGSRDDVERVLGETATEDFIQARQAGSHLLNGYSSVSLSLSVVH